MYQTWRPITTSPSIAVIQGAYGLFCAPTEHAETELDSGALTYRLDNFQQVANVIDALVEDWLRFQQLVAAWRAERGVMSSITEAATCPAYQTIIGMGPGVIPLILQQLKSEGDEPDQWFWALKAITGADPVRKEDRGDFAAMAQSWLQWADEHDAW